MRRIQTILVVALAVTLGLVTACSKDDAEPEAPVKTEAEIAAEQEAARRSEETSALAARATELSGAIAQLSGGDLPESLDATMSQVGEARAGVERLVAELQQASGDGWEAARSRLDAALSDLEAARRNAASAVEDWRRRESDALAARDTGGAPIDSATGLIQGLDGGDYEQYKSSVIERVQASLRAAGRYAGPVDGTLCKPTMEALGEFQREHQLQVSGVPSPMTRSRLFSDGS